MKTKTILTLLLVAVSITAQAQNENEFIPSPKTEFEDVVDALALAGIDIFKHNIGVLDENSTIDIIVEEWKDFKMIDSKVKMSLPVKSTLFSSDEMKTDGKSFNVLRAISKKYNDSLLLVEIAINDMKTPFYLKMKQLDKENRHLPYFPVPYKHKLVETNKNVPIMLYGTMWYDENFNIYRFCGRLWLTSEKDDEDSKEILANSPHYYIVSYRIQKPKE